MKTNISQVIRIIILEIMLIAFITAIMQLSIHAGSRSYNPTPVLYEDSKGFSMSGSSVSAFSYGKRIGSFYVSGDLGEESVKDGYKAYSVNGKAFFGYRSNAADYLTENKNAWNLTSSSNAPYYGKKVKNGEVIIQKSYDRKFWENVTDPVNDVFTDDDINLSSLYCATEDDLSRGCFYRVLVLYELQKKTGTKENWIGWETDTFTGINCIEEYIFYLFYPDTPLVIRDVLSGNSVSDKATVESGFSVEQARGKATSITVQRDGESPVSAKSFDSFYAPGTYIIRTTTTSGKVYQDTIKVSEGLSSCIVPGSRYESVEKGGYSFENKVSTGVNISSLKLAQKSGRSIKSPTGNNANTYGLLGNKACLFLNVSSSDYRTQSGWEVVIDDWGKKEKEQIAGVWGAPVSSGMLIVQKSQNGQVWTGIEHSRYANGISTTDYYSNYAGRGDIPIYLPDGKDIINGYYFRILYAYKIRKVGGKETKRCIEEYRFRLCDDELDDVTIHNLTLKDKLSEMCGEDDEISLEMYKRAETMGNGAVTTTGFSIDKTLNPTVAHTIKLNGKDITSTSQTEFRETGKYDIQLTSAAGSKKNLTIFVDTLSAEETLSLYFGEGFIKDKRVYDENSKYPVFEGGKSKYHFSKISDSYQPLYGEITNITTGDTQKITASRLDREAQLNDPGDYVVSLHNNPTYLTDSPSGDDKIITFNFKVIQEGKAPGPHLNKKSLIDSVRKSMTGKYPKYFGLVYPSAGKGYIYLAFSSWQAARDYAYDNESGMVEAQADGTFLYTGSGLKVPKTRYDDIQELTDARNKFADDAVWEGYFDLSDVSTYRTVDDSVAQSVTNLKTLELAESVVCFADGEKDSFYINDDLPILNSKPYAILDSKPSKEPFVFVKDKYGYDSSKVTIVDSQGNEFNNIKYNIDVEKQLSDAGCATGFVTISEENVYGDSSSYKAVFFSSGDNTATVAVSYYDGDDKKRMDITQDDNGAKITAEAFSIESIKDDLDPYNLILIKDTNGETTAYVADQKMNRMWSDVGKYEITVVNRIGNSFSFTIDIPTSRFATISFKGEGTDGFQPLPVKQGDLNVELPIPRLDGYEFVGYIDEAGTKYDDVLGQVSFSGSKTLIPIWNPKSINIILMEDEDTVYNTIPARYGDEMILPLPELPEGQTFVGWKPEDGSVLEYNKLKISGEKDITLYMVTKKDKLESSQEEQKSLPGLFSKNLYEYKWYFVSAIVLAVIGGGTYALVRKKKKAKSKEPVVLMEDKPDITKVNEPSVTKENDHSDHTFDNYLREKPDDKPFRRDQY